MSTPVERRFELDAAILFSDIMTPLQGMGVVLDFAPGPVVREPIRTGAQIEALRELVPERDVPFVLESIRLVLANVPRGVPLIGFAGGPFTLLCYLVCGRPSKEFAAARTFLYAEPEAAGRLLDRLANAMAAYLRAQAQAGAQALMLFEFHELAGIRRWIGVPRLWRFRLTVYPVEVAPKRRPLKSRPTDIRLQLACVSNSDDRMRSVYHFDNMSA